MKYRKGRKEAKRNGRVIYHKDKLTARIYHNGKPYLERFK
jgi:hypothetical protein